MTLPSQHKKEYLKQWRLKNAEHIKAYWDAWYTRNADKRKDYHHAYNLQHPEVARNGDYKRRALLSKSEKYTSQEWRDLCDEYGNVCLCCLEKKLLQPDHVIPLSKGGPNTISNIQPLCDRCNKRKNDKTIDYR